MAPLTDGEREDLPARAGAGDEPAVDALLDRHLPGLRRYVRARMGPELLALESGSDVVQSVCRELLSDLSSFEYRGDPAFRAWLQRAALRKLVDRQRRLGTLKRRPAGGAVPLSRPELALLADSVGSPSQEAARGEQVAALERAFARLARGDREVLRLIHVEGLTHAEAAERLGCSVESSRKQLSRALARLSRHLG